VGSDRRVSGVVGRFFFALRGSWCYCRKAVEQDEPLPVGREEYRGHGVPGRGPGSRSDRDGQRPFQRSGAHRHDQPGRRWSVAGRQRLPCQVVHSQYGQGRCEIGH